MLCNNHWKISTDLLLHSMNGVVPNSDPCQIITTLVLVGLGLVVGEGLGISARVRIRQSYRDFNERGNNLAGGRQWAQHRN